MSKILVIILLVMVYLLWLFPIEYDYSSFDGTEKIIWRKEPNDGGDWYCKCPCINSMQGTFIGRYYWFQCSKCGEVYTNTKCETGEEFEKFYWAEKKKIEI